MSRPSLMLMSVALCALAACASPEPRPRVAASGSYYEQIGNPEPARALSLLSECTVR